MSASIMEIGRLTNGTTLPLSEYEEPYGQVLNTITIPFNVLWTEARGGITKLLHFSFRNLEDILGQAEVEFSEQQQEEEQLLINSRIISAAFGASRSEVEFPDSLTVSLSHLSRLGPGERSVCVWWDSRVTAWSRAGCHLLSSSPSHSECSCHSLAPLAVLRTASPAQSPQSSSLPILTLQIVTYIVAAISVVCVVLILVKVRTSLSLTTQTSGEFYCSFAGTSRRFSTRLPASVRRRSTPATLVVGPASTWDSARTRTPPPPSLSR